MADNRSIVGRTAAIRFAIQFIWTSHVLGDLELAAVLVADEGFSALKLMASAVEI
jgi:hypothetical protein